MNTTERKADALGVLRSLRTDAAITRMHDFDAEERDNEAEAVIAAVAELIEGYKRALDALDDIANTTSRSLVIGAETYSTSGHAACVRIANAAIDDEKVEAILASVQGGQ